MYNQCNQKELCSIVILSYNQVDYTKQCLESIRKYTVYPYEIIVVDNGSDVETVEYLRKQQDILLVRNEENRGFAGGCNQGIEMSSGKYIMLLNNDTIVTKNWLNNMVELLESNSEIAMVGPLTNSTVGKQMINVPYGNDMEAMQKFAENISSNRRSRPWKTLRLVAFCLLIRRSHINEIGMLDDNFKIGNYEDDDYCIRTLLAHKSMFICRNSFIHHFMNISFNKNNLPREEIMLTNKIKLENKWNGMDWNHHAVTNEWLLQHTLEQEGYDILHIGCGLGTLSIELKDRNPVSYVVGIEEHSIRKEIANWYWDEFYDWDNKMNFIHLLNEKKFNTIIIECSVEKAGMNLLEKIKPLLKERGQVLLRIFNVRHITTLERLVTGAVGGNLLCATSGEFNYYYDKNVKQEMIHKYGYTVLDECEVKKTFSIKQDSIMESMNMYSDFAEDGRIYNRFYQLKLERQIN